MAGQIITQAGPLGPVFKKYIDAVDIITAKKVPDEGLMVVGREINEREQYVVFLTEKPMGPATQIPWGQAAPLDTPSQLAIGRWDPVRIGKQWGWDKNVYKMDIYGMIKSIIPQVIRSHRHGINYECATVNTGGFTSQTADTMGSGIVAEALYSTNHLLAGTGSNAPSVDFAYGPLGIMAGKQNIESQLDPAGQPLMLNGGVVVSFSVLNSQYGMVNEQTKYLPGTNLNDVNVAQDDTTQHVNHYYSTSSTAWFMRAADDDVHGLARVRQFRLEIDELAQTANYVQGFTSDETMIVLWRWWQGTFGTRGA